MLKVVLFGAGAGSLIFMKNNQKSMVFLGYVDNDPQKQGKAINDLHVYAPDQLSTLDYDQIIITTNWAIEVEQQLLEELKIPREKVVLPAKNELKHFQPFSDPENLELARTIVHELSALAIARKIPLVTDFGTLLGIVRDKDILPWDDDVDFSVSLDFGAQIQQLLEDFTDIFASEADWYIERVTSEKSACVGYLLKFFSEPEKRSQFTTSICFREFTSGSAFHMPSLGMWYAPERYFLELETILYKGREIQVPMDYKEYLAFLYGEWQVPKKNMKLTDYEHLAQVKFDSIESNKIATQKLDHRRGK